MGRLNFEVSSPKAIDGEEMQEGLYLVEIKFEASSPRSKRGLAKVSESLALATIRRTLLTTSGAGLEEGFPTMTHGFFRSDLLPQH